MTETDREPDTAGETISFDIETDGEHTELVLPRALVELLASGADTPTDVVADVAQFDFTRRAHALARREDAPNDASSIESDALALFEAHFGTSFEDLLDEQE